MAEAHSNKYYLPEPSHWPIMGTIGLLFLGVGAGNLLTDNTGVGLTSLIIGLVVFLYMLFGWFGTVVRENEAGLYNNQVDISFRWGMLWFIFSEVMFFASFFGALFYARVISVPWLAGAPNKEMTGALLYPDFEAIWPSAGPAQLGGELEIIGAWGIPALNTLILLTSGVTITFAHWALKKENRRSLNLWMAATIALGLIFLGFQAYEYVHAYRDLDLTMGSGIYGSTFFMLTGFHGVHVILGTIMLIAIFGRCLAGHFTPKRHFGFEAVAWYWHFVDVVWLGLFIFVYWL